VRYYRESVSARHPSTVVDGLASLFEHERVHFSKMIASLMPILNMLTSAGLGPLLSPDAADTQDTRRLTSMAECIERVQVVYLGLDALSDSMVGSTIGSILVADLAAVAGDRYFGFDRLGPCMDHAGAIIRSLRPRGNQTPAQGDELALSHIGATDGEHRLHRRDVVAGLGLAQGVQIELAGVDLPG
jgi:hypothetical protein